MALTRVVVSSCPCGTWATRLWPRGARPRRRVIWVLAPLSSTKTSRSTGSSDNRPCQGALFSATSGRFCSAAKSVFFIGQTQPSPPPVHRGSAEGTIQARPQLRQRRVRLRLHQLFQAGLACGGQQGVASAQMGLRFQRVAFLKPLPDPPHRRHAKTQKLRDLTGAFALPVEVDDALAHGNRNRSHEKPYQSVPG
jgi:hypothetical protein